MLKNLFSRILIAASVFTLVGHAHADDNIVHLGQRPDVVHTSASAMTLTTSLGGASKVIAPPGWMGFLKKGIDSKKETTAQIFENEPWTQSLDRWLKSEGLIATLDWSKKRILIDPDPSWQASQAQSSARLDLASSDQAKDQSQPIVEPAHEPVSLVQPPESAPALPTWEIKVSDVRLEAALERWTRQAGYRLLWDADRHILITAEDRYEGTFSQAINRVLNSPAIRQSDYPLEAVLYANDPPLLRITRLGEQQIRE